MPWSQQSWIHQWIVVINLNGPNGSRQKSTRQGYPSTTTPQSPTLSVSVTDSVSVTSVRAMCLYLDNHSISTISENEFVYLPTGDTDRPNTDKAQPTCLRPCCCLYSHYHKCLSPTLHYIGVCYTINKLTNCVSLCYLFDNKMMFSFQY